MHGSYGGIAMYRSWIARWKEDGMYLGTRRLCSLFYLVYYAALLKIFPIMLKLCSIFMPQFPCFSSKFALYGKTVSF